MTDTPDPADLRLHEDDAAREAAYRVALHEERPYLAVEAHPDSFAVVYDLMPGGVQLAEPATDRLADAVTDWAESVVADADTASAELSHSVGPALGSVAGIATEATARDLAATVAEIVLDEANWTAHSPPDDVDAGGLRTN